MKKTLIILALTLSGATFAINSDREKNEKLPETHSILEVETDLNIEDQECYAVCSQGIHNTETGETATVTSIGHSYASCDMAAAICQRNLRAKLKKVLE